jgi:hypothetical protein
MANRTFVDSNFTIVKRKVELFASVAVAAAGAVTLQKWVYPTLGAGSLARTYTTAPTSAAVPTGAAYPLQYSGGAEGILSVTRSAVGTWTVTFQDAYARLLGARWTMVDTSGASGIVSMGVASALTTGTGFLTAANNSVMLLFSSAAGVPADPSAGSSMLLSFELADATEP